MIKAGTLISVVLAVLLLAGCARKPAEGLQDGYFSAQAAEFSHGWKEFVTISVRDGKIVTVEYNATNPSGFIKSWDMDYMALMNSLSGTYPNQYTRYYSGRLLEDQKLGNIDALAGASSSYSSFQQLAAAVLEQAKTGNTSVVQVEITE